MGASGSQVRGFTLAALGLSASWKVAGTTVATLLLPILVLAVPILDPTLGTIPRPREGRPHLHGGRDDRAPARGTPDLPGRPRPQLAPPGALRLVGEARRAASRPDRDRARI